MAQSTVERIKSDFFEMVPFSVALIDKNYEILEANQNFEDYFGEWEGKKCYEACKDSRFICDNCKLKNVFKSGEVTFSEETGRDKDGNPVYYNVHFVPIKNEDDEVTHVVEMSMNMTESSKWQREYSILFERVPCYITIIDKNFKILRANQKYRDTFGDPVGKSCFQVYKNRRVPCKNCPALVTFKEGIEYSSRETGISRTGEEIDYVVNTAPLAYDENGEVQLAIEICTDITEINELEEQIRQAHEFYSTLIQNSPDAIVAIDTHGRTQIFNPAARELFDWKYSRKPGSTKIKEMLPEVFFAEAKDNQLIAKLNETKIKTASGEEVPIMLNAVKLESKKNDMGRVACMQDLRPIKALEKQSLETGRRSSFGIPGEGVTTKIRETISQLYKEINAVEKSKNNGNENEWENIKSNFENSLSGLEEIAQLTEPCTPDLKIISPRDLIEQVVENLTTQAKEKNVILAAESAPNIKSALIDPKSMKTSLSTILELLIESAANDKKKKIVVIKYSDFNNELVFEITYDNIQFPENKIDELPLLKARKIISEHGGKFVHTENFMRITLDRHRLDMIAEEIYQVK